MTVEPPARDLGRTVAAPGRRGDASTAKWIGRLARWNPPYTFLTAVVALIGIDACGGDAGPTTPTPPPPPPPTVAPVQVGTIPEQTIATGQTVTLDVASYFRDPDGGALTYTAASSATTVVSASLSGSTLTLVGVAEGTATVTVTARDPDGLTAAQGFQATVETPNRAPEPVGTIPAQTITAGGTATVDVSSFFRDPDGDQLTYAAGSNNPGVADASMSGNSLTVTAVGEGVATVTVTATDPEGLSVGQDLSVTVAVPDLTVEDFISVAEVDGTSGTVRRGETPSPGDGPAVSVSIGALSIINGGTAQSPVTADEPFTTLYIAVGTAGTEASRSQWGTDPMLRPAPRTRRGTAGKAIHPSLLRRSVTAVRGGHIVRNRVDVDGYYEVSLPAETNAATIVLQFQQSLPSSDFHLIFGVATSAGVVGSQASVPVAVTTVGTGDIQISLSWDSDADLDLHVVEPSGEEIYYGNPTSATGGELDLDSNALCTSGPRNENIRWPAESAPAGNYIVRVDHWSSCGVSPTNYVVRLIVGEDSEVHRGSFSGPGDAGGRGSGRTITTFSFGQVGNHPPLAVAEIPPARVGVDATISRDLSRYFTDPDGDELTYMAVTSNANIAGASVSGSTVTITGIAEGRTTLAVTASDPGGLTAEQSVDVTVTTGGGGGHFRDDFTSSASLSAWETENATTAISEGLMHVTNVADGPGVALQTFSYRLTAWLLRVRLGRAQGDGFASAWWFTGHSRYPWFAFDIGTDFAGDNYNLWLWDGEDENWLLLEYGNSAAVHDGPNELTEITLGWEDEEFFAVAGDTELFRAQPSGDIAALLEGVIGIGLVMEAVAGRAALFDWVEVAGIESSAMADAPGAAIGIEAPRLPKDAPQISPMKQEKASILGGALTKRRKN